MFLSDPDPLLATSRLKAWFLKFACLFVGSRNSQNNPYSHRERVGDVPPDVEFGVAAAPWPA